MPFDQIEGKLASSLESDKPPSGCNRSTALTNTDPMEIRMASLPNITRRTALKLFASAGVAIAAPVAVTLAAPAPATETGAVKASLFRGEGWYLTDLACDPIFFVSDATEVAGASGLMHKMTPRGSVLPAMYFPENRPPKSLGRKISEAEALAFEPHEWPWDHPNAKGRWENASKDL